MSFWHFVLANNALSMSFSACFAQKRKRTPFSGNRRAMADGLTGLQPRRVTETGHGDWSRRLAKDTGQGDWPRRKRTDQTARALPLDPRQHDFAASARSKADCRLRAASGCSSMTRIACPLKPHRSTSSLVPRTATCCTSIATATVRLQSLEAPVRHTRRQPAAMGTRVVTGTRALRARCQ
jgi:hypothetical protein